MSGPASSGTGPVLPENAPREGDILAGKYRVESVLGIGGMGLVLLVRHIDLGQQMAIKLMMPGVIHDDQASARFVREARSAAAIQSEHVVRIFDVGTFDSGLPYMVMELLRGEDLSQLLQRETRLPIEDAVDYVLQAGHAIAEAHARGIVHRDLKPSNIFVTKRSNGTALVKVLDFGISKAMNPDDGAGPNSANLTATSAIMGSPLYMSPEQVRNAKSVDARTDIWALGVILHELLTGAPAFSADTLPGICAAITADDPPPLRSLRDDAPADLEAVIAKCLEKNVSARYQTTRELMTALRNFASYTGRVEPTSIPAAMTMREAGSLPPAEIDGSGDVEGASSASGRAPRPSGREGAPRSKAASRGSASKPFVEAPRSSGKMGAASLASSTATVSWRGEAGAPAPGQNRKAMGWIVAAALLGGVAVGAIAFTRSDKHESPTSATATPPAGRRSFTLFLDANPAGAEVWEGDERIGQAPMQLSLDNEALRQRPRTFVVKRAGFQPYSIVQGPSDDNVRTLAPLVALAREPEAPAAVAAPVASPASAKDRLVTAGPAKATKATPSRPEPAATPVVTTPTPPPAASSPPAPPSDIRLQR